MFITVNALSSVNALKAVNLTALYESNDDKAVIMTTFPFNSTESQHSCFETGMPSLKDPHNPDCHLNSGWTAAKYH